MSLEDIFLFYRDLSKARQLCGLKKWFHSITDPENNQGGVCLHEGKGWGNCWTQGSAVVGRQLRGGSSGEGALPPIEVITAHHHEEPKLQAICEKLLHSFTPFQHF